MESRFPKDGSIPEFLAALASPDDAHGAVAAAAIGGAIGVALLQRIAALPRSLPDDAGTAHASAVGALLRIQEELLETVETQTAVALFAARSLPHANDAERDTRERAIQLALRAAADVPLEVMRLSAQALRHAETVSARSGRGAATEVELAVRLLVAAFNAARSNLEGKLPILTDSVRVASIGDEVAALSDGASVAADAARSYVAVPPT